MRAKNKLVKRVSSEFYLLFSLSRYLFFVTSLVYILSFFHSSSFSLSFDFCLLASCVVCAEFKEFIASFYILEHIFLNINFALCGTYFGIFFFIKNRFSLHLQSHSIISFTYTYIFVFSSLVFNNFSDEIAVK